MKIFRKSYLNLSASSQVIINSDQLFVSREFIGPGKKASAPHYHKELDEHIFVLTGTVEAIEGEISVTLNAGDSVYFRAGSGKLHYVENRSDSDAEFLLIRKAQAEADVVY